MSTPKKIVHAKAVMFATKSTEEVSQTPTPPRSPKVLDSSKTAFLTQTSPAEAPRLERVAPGQLNPSKLAQFTNQNSSDETRENGARVPKALDESKTAFLTQERDEEGGERTTPGQLDQNKMSHFGAQPSTRSSNQASAVSSLLIYSYTGCLENGG
mgnify:FL=1